MDGMWRKVRALGNEFTKLNATTYASSITYFSFLSLVPLLAICIALVSLVGIGEQEVVAFFVKIVPDALHGVVETLVNDAYESSGVAFSISSLSMLWSASQGIKALRAGLNEAYAVKESRSIIAVAVISILSVMILGILLAAMMYLVFYGSVMRSLAHLMPEADWQQGISSILDPVVMLVTGTLVIGACYAYLPSGTRRYLTQLPGAACASIACGVLSYGFRVYVDNFSNFTMLYGSIATVALFLYWMYLVSFVLILGGLVNRVLEQEATGDAASARDE